MSKREKIKAVAGMILTVVVMIAVGRIVKANDYLPGFVFWIVAEVLLLTDGYTIYSMIIARQF